MVEAKNATKGFLKWQLRRTESIAPKGITKRQQWLTYHLDTFTKRHHRIVKKAHLLTK